MRGLRGRNLCSPAVSILSSRTPEMLERLGDDVDGDSAVLIEIRDGGKNRPLRPGDAEGLGPDLMEILGVRVDGSNFGHELLSDPYLSRVIEQHFSRLGAE